MNQFIDKISPEKLLDDSRLSDHAAVKPEHRYLQRNKYNDAGITSILSELAFLGRTTMNWICSTDTAQ